MTRRTLETRKARLTKAAEAGKSVQSELDHVKGLLRVMTRKTVTRRPNDKTRQVLGL